MVIIGIVCTLSTLLFIRFSARRIEKNVNGWSMFLSADTEMDEG